MMKGVIKMKKRFVLVALLAVAISISSCSSKSSKTTNVPASTTVIQNNVQSLETPSENNPADNQNEYVSSKAEEKQTIQEVDQGTYESNPYYEIIETVSYKNSIDNDIIIHKVLAKQDVSISATLLAYDASDNVIGKSSSDITLTKGKTNFFYYYFSDDISNAKITAQYKVSDSSFMDGDRDAVEMVKYNITEEDVYITVKQTSDNLGSFAKFKLLLYKGDKIVGAEENCYLDVYAGNLNGKGTTDVAKIWEYGENYDSIEFIFEP